MERKFRGYESREDKLIKIENDVLPISEKFQLLGATIE